MRCTKGLGIIQPAYETSEERPMEDSFTVTIGVCARDSEFVLKNTVEGIMSQDFPKNRTEVIFVDDGSKDSTLSIMLDLASHMETRVRVFHQEWSGLGVARNAVVRNAGGRYVLWVDDDVILQESHVRELASFMEHNPNVAGVGMKYAQSCEENIVSVLENLARKSSYFRYGCKEPPSDAQSILRLSVAKQVGGYDNRLRATAEDLDLASRIKASGWRLVRRTVLYHSKSMTKWKDVWRKYFRYGYGSHYAYHRNRCMFALYKKIPLLCLIDGLTLFAVAYRLTGRRKGALLPFYHFLVRTSWFLGFMMSHIDGYEPKKDAWQDTMSSTVRSSDP